MRIIGLRPVESVTRPQDIERIVFQSVDQGSGYCACSILKKKKFNRLFSDYRIEGDRSEHNFQRTDDISKRIFPRVGAVAPSKMAHSTSAALTPT